VHQNRLRVTRRSRNPLFLATIVVAVVTALWAIALYQHFQAYYRIFGVHHEVLRDYQGPNVVYAAHKYQSEKPPSDWYMPEELGIYRITEYGENGWLHIAVIREEEPFPLQEEQPIFKYKDKFYQVSPLWATPALPEPWWVWGNGPILAGIGMILIFAWIILVAEWGKARKPSHACNQVVLMNV